MARFEVEILVSGFSEMAAATRRVSAAIRQVHRSWIGFMASWYRAENWPNASRLRPPDHGALYRNHRAASVCLARLRLRRCAG